MDGSQNFKITFQRNLTCIFLLHMLSEQNHLHCNPLPFPVKFELRQFEISRQNLGRARLIVLASKQNQTSKQKSRQNIECQNFDSRLSCRCNKYSEYLNTIKAMHKIDTYILQRRTQFFGRSWKYLPICFYLQGPQFDRKWKEYYQEIGHIRTCG